MEEYALEPTSLPAYVQDLISSMDHTASTLNALEMTFPTDVDLDGAHILEDATAMELDSLDSTARSPSAKRTSPLVSMEDSATPAMEDATAQELDTKEKPVRMTSTSAPLLHLHVLQLASIPKEGSHVHHVLKEQLEVPISFMISLEQSSLEDAHSLHHLNKPLHHWNLFQQVLIRHLDLSQHRLPSTHPSWNLRVE